MDEATRLAKNAKIRENGKATRERHAAQACKAFELKIRHNKLSRFQKESLKMVFVEAKWLRNDIIATGVRDYVLSGQVSTRDRDGEVVVKTLIHTSIQMRQVVLDQVKFDLRTLKALNSKGHRVGSLRFKSEVSSINLPQPGTSYAIKGNRARVQKIGWMRVDGVEQLEGFELANARLLSRPDGYYLAVVAFKNKDLVEDTFQPGTVIGLDMGLRTHITLSDGSTINVLVGETDHLKRLQQKLHRQVKGSNNYHKTKDLIGREYRKMDKRKDDYANKIVHNLLLNEIVFMQDENISKWKRRRGYIRGGKRIQHSILGRVKQRLAMHPRVFVNPKFTATTQLCVCGETQRLDLSVRTYTCPKCGYSLDRDLHAAQNMIRLGAHDKSFLPTVYRQQLVEHVSDWRSMDFEQRAAKQEALWPSVRV